MAYRLPAGEIKEQLSRFLRYFVRLAPIVVIIGTITWFFLFRSPDGQTNTAETNETSETDSETIASANPDAQQHVETKVADNAKNGETAKEETKEEGKLPDTGPADTAAIVAAATVGGTLFWEWRLRRIRARAG